MICSTDVIQYAISLYLSYTDHFVVYVVLTLGQRRRGRPA